MNRNLLKSLFVTLALVFTAIVAQANCRIIGDGMYKSTNNLDAEQQSAAEETMPEHIYMMGINGSWDLDAPSATLNRVEGTSLYKANVEITNKYFAFFTELKKTWKEQDQYRWRIAGKVVPNTELKLFKSSEGNTVIERLGTYEVTIDFAKKTVILYDNTFDPEADKYIYFVGDANNWNTNSYFAKIPRTEYGIYKGNVTFSVGTFAIGTMLGDMATFNAHRFCPSYFDVEYLDTNCDEYLYEYSEDEYQSKTGKFGIRKGDEGEYPVYINLNEHNLKFGRKVETSITNITSTPDNITNYYDLTGRNLGTKKPAKGLYIKDGKKVVVK